MVKGGSKAAASRPASESTRRVAPVATAAASAARDAKDAEPAALRAEIRALKRGLTAAEEKANDADARRTRAVTRATATLRRENESLEAHLTLLVQEIGQIKHVIDRVPRLEADLRSRDLQLAEREQAWQSERSMLQAEIERLRPSSHRAAAGAKTGLAAAAAASARSHSGTRR